MADATQFDHDPPLLGMYLRAVMKARAPVRTHARPEIAVERRGVRIDEGWLRDLRALFGAPPDGGVPLSTPHVLAGGLQLAVLTDPRFPLRILGAVHVRSTMEVMAPLATSTAYTLRVSLGELREVEKGTEHDLLTELIDEGGAPAWRGVSTNLTLDPKASRGTRGQRPDLPEGDDEVRFDVPVDIGRRYGAVSQDRNPIHLHPLSARLFGFPRAIAHGMWTVGRALSALGHDAGRAFDRLEVAFKRPLFLPGYVAVRSRRDDDALRFWVVDEKAGVVHVEGTLREAG